MFAVKCDFDSSFSKKKKKQATTFLPITVLGKPDTPPVRGE